MLICGSRNWDDWKAIRERMRGLPRGSIIIQGGARGADRMAADIARGLEMEVREYPARWETYGRSAGPIRNQQMLDEERPDLVMAFADDLATSKGTKDMVERARKAGIPTEIHP